MADVSGPYVHLSDTGTLSYGAGGASFTFDPLYSSRITSRPRYDEAQRVITCWEYTLEVEARVTSGAPSSTGTSTNATMVQLGETLQQPGGILVYKDKGWDFQVNGGKALGGPAAANATSYDAMWGPLPKLLSFRPDGNGNQAVVKWEVSWAQPSCVCCAVYKNAPMAINYEQEWSFDEQGYLQLKISGYLEIPLTRKTQGDHTVADDADRYRDRIYPDIPLGYEWRSRDFKLSKDRRRLDFSLVMGQIFTARPPGAIKAEAHAKYDTTLIPDGFAIWHGALDGTFTVPPGGNKANTYLMWLLLQQRHLGTQFQLLFGAPALAGAAAPTVIMDSFGMEEDVFGPSCSYHCTYRVIGATLEWLLLFGGLWQPMPGTNFGLWKQSLAVPWSSRGQAQARFDDAADALVDLCVGKSPGTTLRPGFLPGSPPDLAGRLVGTGGLPVNLKSTWLAYENRLSVLATQKVPVHKPLVPPQTVTLTPQPLPSTYGSSPAGASGGAGTTGATTSGGFPGLPPGGARLVNEIQKNDPPVAQGRLQNQSATIPDKVQKVGQESFKVRMTGHGVRFGVRVPAPELISVGTMPAQPEQRWAQEWEQGGIYGVPVCWAVWDMVYVIAGSPGPYGILPNPIYG